MKKILIGILAVIVVIVAVVLIRTAIVESKQIAVDKTVELSLNKELLARHLSGAIQVKSISYQDPAMFDKRPFEDLHRYLEKTYPLVHKTLKREKVNGYSLLYTWGGSDKNAKGILLMSHLDVVPIEKGTEKQWTHPPFSGKIADGFIWGRGTMDVKNGVIAALEAVEYLIRTGFRPERTVYLAFGHDEEIGGANGATKIAALLKSRGKRLAIVVDEGGTIISDMFPGLKNPIALVGIAEKGYLTLKLTAEGEGGHSSMPPKQTNVGILATAIHKLERNPFPGELKGPARLMFEFLGPEMPFTYRMIFANLWLFSPVLESMLEGKPSTNAMLRTTTAATMFEGSVKENVLPSKATAVVNFRILPGETAKSVTEYVREVIDDPRITITPTAEGRDPSFVSNVDSAEFRSLHQAIKQLFPDVVVAPYLVLGGTDSRHYMEVAEHIYRFIPMRMKPEDLKRIHGTNERMSIDNFAETVKFDIQFIKNSQKL
jgi:carboxypeptidase PM20D1